MVGKFTQKGRRKGIMHVQIICKDYNSSDKILPRLANTLARTRGWEVGRTPRGDADLNHFSVYIEYGETYRNWNSTPTAAYFTHFEGYNRNKARWWEYTLKKVDLCITTSLMYKEMLINQGAKKVFQVHPPIDSRFIIADPPVTNMPIVGVSGFIPKRYGDRKGADLLNQLRSRPVMSKVHLIASGGGWPNIVSCRYSLEKLPRFFQGLSILLCTSLIEGNPMPPLEALACGIKIVIPTGVGLLDELPKIDGIYRYEKGNVKQMEKALKRAINSGDVDRQALRHSVANYTEERWISDHQEAFESLINNVPPVKVSDTDNRGVYYVAFGKPARKCVKQAMKSFRKFMPRDIEIALASESPIGIEDHHIKCDDVDVGARHAKTAMYDLAPAYWDYVMYLDADTEIISPDPVFLFKILKDGWDMVICTNPGKFHIARRMVRPDKDECNKTFNKIGTQEVIQLNGGVLAFRRNERTRDFFHAWHKEWKKWGKRDQAALLRALWDHPVKLFVLNNRWNTIEQYVENPRGYTAGIIHHVMTARRWSGTIQGRSDSKEAWDKVKEFGKGYR